MRKAYSYIRMSTNIQLKGDSLRRQLELSQKYALENQLELVETIDGIPFKDIGISGFTGQNSQSGALSLFIKCLDEDKVPPNSVLLIESIDRLSRTKLTEALSLFMGILGKGIEIVTLADNQKYTEEILNKNPTAIYLSLAIMLRANEESETKSKRLKAVWENKRKNAHVTKTTKVCPGWMNYNEKKKDFDLIADRAETVKTIFHMCINTCGLYGIARNLNEMKVPVFGRGKIWHRSYLKKIISSRTCLGEYQPHTLAAGKKIPNGDPVKNYYPSVVEEDTYLLANAALAKRDVSEKGRKGLFFSNLFTGIIFCAECGSATQMLNKGIRSDRQLRCSNRQLHGGCESSDWNLTNFENVIFRHLLEVDFESLLIEKPIPNLALEIDALIAKRNNKKNQVETLLEMTNNDSVSSLSLLQIISKMNEVNLDIESYDKAILFKQTLAKEAEMNIQSTNKAELKKLITELDRNKENYLFRSQLNQILRKTINRIELVDYKMPYQIWDIENDDSALVKYMDENYLTIKDFDKTIASEKFKRFYKNYYKRIVIKYKSGAIRHLLFGADISFNSSNRKIKKD